MATPVEMPKLGNTVEECLLAQWKKHKGDQVSNGEILAEIETDKATFELAAPVDGILLETFFDEGALVPVFTKVCVIGVPGEDAEPYRPSAAAAPAALRQASEAPPPAEARPSSAPVAVAPVPSAAGMAYSPRARQFAREHGLTPRPLAGSGPGGRVLEQDLKNLYASSPKVSSLARNQMEAGHEANRQGTVINGTITARDLDTPPARMSKIRELIARRVRESLSGSAQYTLNASADATGLLSLRAKIKAAATSGTVPDIDIHEMVMFCAAEALLEMPELNAELIEGKIYNRAQIHLGFACDTDKGLLVPVIRDCQELSLAELALRAKDLIRQVTEGTIAPDDLAGATFTVSNLGNLGIESFTPIINLPQVALLGVDAIELRPVRREGRVEFVDHIGLSLTCDHQVIDGAPGARFLQILKDKIEKIAAITDLTL